MERFENMPETKSERSLTLEEKVSLIEKKLNIDYPEEERADFDQWLLRVPENSFKEPIAITSTREITDFLPKTPNYKGEKINLFFSKEEFTSDELQTILENFAQQNSSFEISIVKHTERLISVGIGNKVRNSSTILEGEYFGHYHPADIELENKEILPKSFVAGLMPSFGDIKGFFKHLDSVKGGTKIFSKNGYVNIRPIRKVEKEDLILDEFKEKYFDLFLGENKFGFKSDEEVVKYFEDKFGFKIEFYYVGEEKLPK